MLLLSSLFIQTSCSYRVLSPFSLPCLLCPLSMISYFIVLLLSFQIEMFWPYELCHGIYLRQYHEEKQSVNVWKTV